MSAQNQTSNAIAEAVGTIRKGSTIGGAAAAQTLVHDESDRGTQVQWRWIAIAVFSGFSFLNFLDRQLLAAVAPTLKSEFHLSNSDYGLLVSAFSIAYMAMTPIAGWMIDRIGLNVAAIAAVTLWSVASAATGLSRGIGSVMACRGLLGAGEAAGIPCAAKAGAVYLDAKELAIGTAVQQIGLFGGGIAAPLIVAAIAPTHGWRAVFVAIGLLSAAWIPLWRLTSRAIPGQSERTRAIAPVRVTEVLRDHRMWGVVVFSLTVMTLYSLWLNWTTIYLVQIFHLAPADANRYFAWLPPVFATLGGFVGGALAWKKISSGESPVGARVRICTVLTPLALVTAVVPLAGSPLVAAAAISASFFACMAIVTNLHVIPIDLFGRRRAAFTSSVLTFAFALLQTVTAPAIGLAADHFGFGDVCRVLAVLPILGVCILRITMRGVAD